MPAKIAYVSKVMIRVSAGWDRGYTPHISRCFLSSASTICSVRVRLSSSASMVMYAGMARLIFPSGPEMSMVEPGVPLIVCRLLTLLAWFLLVMNVTSGGRVSGARPILERDGLLVEKEEEENARAGTRKLGRVDDWGVMAVEKTDCSARDVRREQRE